MAVTTAVGYVVVRKMDVSDRYMKRLGHLHEKTNWDAVWMPSTGKWGVARD